MTRNDSSFVGESEKTVVDGGQQLADVASGKVGATYGAGEEGVTGEDQGVFGKVEADWPPVCPGVWRMFAVMPFLLCSGLAPMVMSLPSSSVCVGGEDLGVGTPSHEAWTSIIFTSGRSFWL